MNKPFNDVIITNLLKDRSYSIQGSFFRIYLRLSDEPPAGWAYLFHTVWQGAVYSMKRHAAVEGNSIWIECVPEEVKQYHLEELKKAVAQTNAHYRAWLKQRADKAKMQAEQNSQHRQQLDDLGQDLSF